MGVETEENDRGEKKERKKWKMGRSEMKGSGKTEVIKTKENGQQ